MVWTITYGQTKQELEIILKTKLFFHIFHTKFGY